MPITPFSDRTAIIDIIASDPYIESLGFLPINILNTAYSDEKLEEDTFQIFVFNAASQDGNTSIYLSPVIEIDVSVPQSYSSEAQRAAEQIIALLQDKKVKTYGNDVAAAFMDDKAYINTEKALNKVKEAAEEYIEAEINLAETTYLLENGIPKTIQEQKDMEKAILETVDATEEAVEIYRSYISTLGTIDQQKVDFYKIIDSEEYESAKNTLLCGNGM